MCGIVGVFGVDDGVEVALLSLHALQHRGQEGVGIAVGDGQRIVSVKFPGLVTDNVQKIVIALSGIEPKTVVGHIRYSTTGKTEQANLQPIVVDGFELKAAIVHNGNLVNFASVRRELERTGSVFTTTTDTEVILHLIARAKGSFLDRLKFAFGKVKGAWSCIISTPNELWAVRDPLGFRPLVLGRYKNGYIVASETCAFDVVGAEFMREIEPGEILKISKSGLESFKLPESKEQAKCIFEYVYFARPDSNVFGRNVYEVRIEMGRELAREHPADADCVIPVPDSGLFAAIGYARESGIPFEYGIVRSHYIGRTFIEPTRKQREKEVKLKLNPIKGIIKGKRIVLIDDSIVRGNTSRKIVRMLKEAGAKEVHMRISSPPFAYPCYFGIDTPSRGELIASSHSVEEIRQFLGCDTLGYLSVEGMLRAVKRVSGNSGRTDVKPDMKDGFCLACFTGNYPVPPEDSEFIVQLRLFR